MPTNKDLKRLVRARMRKTGEAYTAARTHIIKKPKALTKSVDYAALAGMSDEKVEAKTGCTWERWVYALDRKGAERMSHRDIAALVSEKYKVDGWWSQTVTVGYERIKGLRARGQRRDGTYEAGKSRTFNVPVTALFDAWANARVRRRWLNGESAKVRTATAPKSMRLGWTDGSIIAVGFTAKGKSKSSVALAHTKLPDRETANRFKEYWSNRLDALGEVLSES
ncbi:MAG: hypothetical protein M3P12_10540 [Gemmatimonadota bacterium]|nr:hypothetical protein [Gemmatimonadota bacterium]